MTRAFDRALPIALLGDLFTRDAKTHEPRWRSAPRSAFKSEREYAQWNRRYSGQPVLETPGGLRVELVRNKLRRKWQVQYVVGRRRYSASSHSDYERADRDYRFARIRFSLFGGESFIKLMGRPAKRVIISDPTTLRGKRTGR
jgi:hypothetical protein